MLLELAMEMGRKSSLEFPVTPRSGIHPVLTLADARADREARGKARARGCLTVALTTPPSIAAELIDQAISTGAECRNASNI